MEKFDWHSGEITSSTRIDNSYRNTQNVRRFFKSECGVDFKFDRSFMLWIRGNIGKTMGDAVSEWLHRQTI